MIRITTAKVLGGNESTLISDARLEAHTSLFADESGRSYTTIYTPPYFSKDAIVAQTPFMGSLEIEWEEPALETWPCNDCELQCLKGDELCGPCYEKQRRDDEEEAMHPEWRCPPRE